MLLAALTAPKPVALCPVLPLPQVAAPPVSPQIGLQTTKLPLLSATTPSPLPPPLAPPPPVEPTMLLAALTAPKPVALCPVLPLPHVAAPTVFPQPGLATTKLPLLSAVTPSLLTTSPVEEPTM